MKTVVIYQSSTGFTKQYAQWIASDLECDAIDIKKLSGNDLKQYDYIIYGGWIMGNMIMGLKKIMNMNPKQLVVFAVGSTQDSEEIRNAIREQNQLGETPFFYVEGGFRFDKLNFMTRTILKMLKKSIAKKTDKTEQDIYMEKILGTSFDHSDVRYIASLVAYVKGIV